MVSKLPHSSGTQQHNFNHPACSWSPKAPRMYRDMAAFLTPGSCALPGAPPTHLQPGPSLAPHLDTLSGNLKCQAPKTPSTPLKEGPEKRRRSTQRQRAQKERRNREKPVAHCSKEGSFQGGSFLEAVVEEGQGGGHGEGSWI